MAFIPGSISGTVKTTAPKTGGFVPGSVSKTIRPAVAPLNFVPGSTSNLNFGGGGNYRALDTSQGLYNLAAKNNLKDEADKILKAQAGERTKEIFSGGFISDIFDVLSTLQYGVTGILKGKSFKDGILSRESFTDEDALGDKGIPGIITGIALDIAVDPLTYIAPFTVLKKVPLLEKALKAGKEATFGRMAEKTIDELGDLGKVVSKTGEPLLEEARKITNLEEFVAKNADILEKPDLEKIFKASKAVPRTFQELEGGTVLGRYLASKFSYMFGADPVFREIAERSVGNIATETDLVADMVRPISKLEPSTASKMLVRGADDRWKRESLDNLAKVLKPEELSVAKQLYTRIDELGKQAVDLGLLSKEKFEENVGEYIKNAYKEYELATKKNIFGFSKAGIKPIQKRVEGLTLEQMQKLGQIDNPAYLLFKTLFDLTKNVENAKLMSQVSQKFGSKVAREGFIQIPDTKKWGKLAGMYIPKYMHEYLTEIIEPSNIDMAKKLVANFKFFKVVMNPATHARNLVSNKILNWWKLGMNPLDPRVIKTDATAIKEIAKGGGRWISEVRPLGYNVDTFASQELKTLLDSPEAMSATQKAGSVWQKTKKYLGDIYQKEENHAKLSAYIFNRQYKNLSPEEAWKAAESATFNYAQVTPFVRKLRESIFGFPFITFTVKSTPVVAETMLKAPHRISAIGKIKNGIEKLAGIEETDRERASEPSWVKDGFYIKLPMKDKYGRSAYFDLTYILPFGDLMAGNYFERGISTKTGLPESPTSAALKKSPFISLVSELGKNQDFYGNSIWKDSDPPEKQMGDLMRHLSKTYLPPLVADQLPGGYNEKGERQQRGIVGAAQGKAGEENQTRTLMQEMLRNVGMKIQPIDADIQETYQEWNRKKALQRLLIENGVLNTFSRTYVPKEK